MRKTLTLSAVVILAFLSVAAIKFFSDYPNAVPVGSDFFVLQRNQSYINASRDQVKNDWFNNPNFTGSGSIVGSFGIGGNLPIGGKFYGDLSGGSNYGAFVYMLNLNGNGTNESFWGVTTFDELDVNNFYPTNLFTLKTNYDLLGTDGNGKLKLAIPVAGTNLFLLSGANITFTTNGDGSITIAASGSVNIQTITNTTLYTTNAYITTVYISTNYTTNFNFVTGKGNTLIVTNVSVNGTLTNSGVAASSIVSTDAKQVETNAVIAARLSFSGNSLDLASGIVGAGTYRSVTVDTYGRTTAGSNPTTFSGYGISDSAANLFSALTTYDFSSATNLTYQYKTNAVSNGVLAFNGVGQAYRTNFNADITIASLTLGPNGASTYESLVLLCTNSDTSVHKITWPSGVFSGGVAAVSWITNGYWNEVVVDHFATLYTNAQVKN